MDFTANRIDIAWGAVPDPAALYSVTTEPAAIVEGVSQSQRTASLVGLTAATEYSITVFLAAGVNNPDMTTISQRTRKLKGLVVEVVVAG